MAKILAYTFETFPYKKDLPFVKFSVFKKLNDDIARFCHEILTVKPDEIVGFARSKKKYSTIEKYSVNEFHGGKKILSDASDGYELHIPSDLDECFTIRSQPTKSFCNLTTFKIKNFLKENNLDIPLSFYHILQNDLKKLPKY